MLQEVQTPARGVCTIKTKETKDLDLFEGS